ncbi:MAG: OmpA family protein, partial [Marinilabiliaceae bacterium]
NCHYHLNEIDESFEMYQDLEEHLEGEDFFNYASASHKFGFYEGAIELYEECIEKDIGNPAQIKELIRSCEWAIENRSFQTDYRANPSDLLTYGQSFGIQFYKDGVVYSSSSGESDEVDRYGKEFLNLYYSRLKDGKIQDQRLFSENLVFDYHVGAISFTSDEETMYYTRSVRVRGGDSRIKIFRVTYEDGEWGNEEELEINSDDYDCAYPAVTPDDEYLIFASNMSGGHGGTDLYIAERRGNGRFGRPQNLGSGINTFGDERFPFVSQEYDLYFASDGHIGFGGLDVFKAAHAGGTEWEDVENMMQPINSNNDDFGYVIDPNNPDQGFLSSDRTAAEGDVIFFVEPRGGGESDEKEEADSSSSDDDLIFGVSDEEEAEESESESEPEPEPEEETEDLSMFPDALSTTVRSSYNDDPVEEAEVVVEDDSETVISGSTDRNGKVHLTLPDKYRQEDQEFEISVSKNDDYKSYNMVVDIMELEDIAKNGITLTPVFDDEELDDIGTMVIPYRGDHITGEGKEVLDQLAVYLKNHPDVVVKLNSHTDSRGNKYNNLQVSQKVAEKAENYLMERGIDDKNMIPRGYGERYLVNDCERGRLCEEEEHLENRRIEVVVWRRLSD